MQMARYGAELWLSVFFRILTPSCDAASIVIERGRVLRFSDIVLPVSGSAMTATKILWGQILTVFAIVLTTTWGATQWTAWRLGFQPQLGTPWFDLARAIGLSAAGLFLVVVLL